MPASRLTAALRWIDWRLALVAAVALVLLQPIRQTGWMFDDAHNANMNGWLIWRNQTVLDSTRSGIYGWTFYLGRVNPLIHVWMNGWHYLFTDLGWYKWGLELGTLLDIVLFYRLLRLLKAPAEFAALCALLVPILIQFRQFNDPVYAFYCLMQLMLLLTVLSLHSLQRFLDGGRYRHLAASAVFYLLSALTYEVTYPLWLLHAWLILLARPGWKRGAALVLPFLSTPVLLTLGSMWIRALPQYIGGGYATDLNPGRVASTFSKQVTAAWPGSYTLFDPKHHLEGVLSWRTLAGHWQLGLLVFVAVWALAAGMARRAREGGVRLAGVTGLGLLLAVLPAPLIAVCSRYQGELKYGLGHLPVYLEYFGVALLLGSAAAFLARRARLPGLPLLLPVALAALVSTVATVHREANLRVVASWREPFLTPRMEIEELVRAGFLERVPAGATLCTDFYPWDHDGNGVFFYSCYTRAPVGAVVPASGLSAEALAGLPDPQAQKRAAAPAGRVRYVRPGKAGGFAVTGTLRQVRATPGGVVTESALDMVRVAVSRTPGQPADRPFTLTAAGWDGVSLAGPRRLVVIPSDELIPVRRTRNWTIYDVPPRSHLEGESIQLGFSATDGAPSEALAPADLVRGRDLLLPEDHEPVIHLGFQGPCPPHGRTLIPLTTEGGWTFEAVLRPEPGQVHYATIASNHPGDGCDGFTIEQDGATPNAYLVQFGDGTAWHRVGRFQLTAGEWAHLAVVHERGRASVHVNGACVAVYERPGLTVHPSAMPLRLGDWAGSQRELHGTIREVRLLDQPLPAAEILRNSQRVLGALTAGEVHPAS